MYCGKPSAITSCKGFDKMKKCLAICSMLCAAGFALCSCGSDRMDSASDSAFISDNDHDKRISDDDYERKDKTERNTSAKEYVRDAVDGAKDAGEDIVRGAGDAAQDIIDGFDGSREPSTSPTTK